MTYLANRAIRQLNYQSFYGLTPSFLYYNIFNCNFFCGVSLNELKNLFADIYCWNKWFY